MNDIVGTLLLLSVPGLPLLLLLALYPCRPWFRYLALLPAIIVVSVPLTYSVELPWLLFGTGLSNGGVSRWLLAILVILWLVAASVIQKFDGQTASNRFTRFFLLTMAGNLGVVLATDQVGFFVFSTLMGYGFYGLLVSGRDDVARRAGRAYLVLLVLSDLALFEALLIVLANTDDLSFTAAVQAMAQSPSLGLYLSMVISGFALKAGIWPLTFWLPLAYRSISLPVAVLLGGVPVAIALLGLVRWLPLGEIIAPTLGLIIQGLGLVTVFYAMFYVILLAQKIARLKTLPAYATILAVGLFFVAIGTGLSNRAIWHGYGDLAYLFIILLVFALAILNITIVRLGSRSHCPAMHSADEDEASLWFERYPGMVLAWAAMAGYETLPRWRSWWLAQVSRLWLRIRALQSALDFSERALQSWVFAVTLFLLLGIAVVFIGLAS